MLPGFVQNAGLLVLGALSTFIPTLGAYDVSAPLDPQGPLKVTLDYGLAMSWPQERAPEINNIRRNWQFSSHLVFASRVGDSDEESPPISDGQLWQIARDAVGEMQAGRKRYGILVEAEPGAMGILAWGNEIILASSMKGAGSFSYDFQGGNTEVARSLQQCQMAWRDTTQRHKNRGNCAEAMAAHLYYKDNNNLQDRKARVGTWVKSGVLWDKIDPCGTGHTDYWGCNLFTQNQGLRVLDKQTPSEPYTLADLAGGPILAEQIQLCGGEPRAFDLP
ncbi:hypothetical protein P168DRAFT_343239 [Aspergillus campestris IBT 28561]|uniref:Uncharacterized protein n=1 Tax=Aspergillus campestris (strain IBT 28561) TaxID=1392248 RepID=A0A2I1D2K0_ASPC2|nr:uncharacterized protein P168DRAFT_343239 [Aspergillus campestris IBT 28561]PKY04113.1 hypothetical protein P168DRAFT_343239 [Aspergillus campestris IBT 28561]